MARIFRLSVDVYPPSEHRPQYCVEAWQTVRTARAERVLHFGFDDSFTPEDVDYLEDTIGLMLRGLLHRTIGIQERLEL
jgi:hypothetical protein